MFNLSITQLLILSITLATYIKRIKHLVQFLYTMYSEHYERIYQKVSIIKTMVLLIKTTNIVLYRNFYKELLIH
jgi:hypothetical protein